MKFIKKNIEDLEYASYNPRKKLSSEDKEYQKIKNSIEEFGYVEPIIINKDNTIIGGHQRFTVLKDLGYKEVDVIQIDIDKTKEKALNIALNKITGEWDYSVLGDLLLDLDSLNYDLEITGFDMIEIENILAPVEDKQNERHRTDDYYNLDLIEEEMGTNDFWQMPIIENDNYIPDDLIGFNYAKTSKNKNAGIHFYLDDYQFERIWNNPEKYVDIMKEYECILSPDFSLYLDMPMPMKIWNIYRSRKIGQFFQKSGIKVIPTMSWAEEETFKFCFKGIPKGSIVSVNTIGVKKDKNALKIWKSGMDEMIKQIEPSAILVYGGKIEYDYGNIDVIYYDNKVTERMIKNDKN